MRFYPNFLFNSSIISPPTQIVLYCYDSMYSTFRNSKLLCRLPYGGIVLDNVTGNFHCPFFNIFFHEKTPANAFLTFYAGRLDIMIYVILSYSI